MRIVRIKPCPSTADKDGNLAVYDLTVANTHLYCADGMLVSNSKRVAMMSVNALLSHGATENLRDVGSIRGQRNEDYWLQFMQGFTPRAPKIPLVYEKFVHQLKASGINVVREGSQTNIMALTSGDVDVLAGDREIQRGDTVRFDHELKPIPGGLFDPQLTGGHGGKRWSAVKLEEPLPNPVMEEPIRRILGLTEDKFAQVISGQEKLAGGLTGPVGIAKALDQINLHQAIGIARTQIAHGTKTARDQAIRKLKYLTAAERLGLHPRDWMLNRVPVLPPIFRPVSVMGSTGVPLVSDANYLYKELIEANDNLRNMKGEVGEGGVGAERLAVYHAFKAVTGLGEPITTKSQDKKVEGILKSIFGSSPKYGTVQRKLLASTVDNVGRAVIIPNPDFDMDTVGLPEEKAFDVYSKFIVRRLRRRGMQVSQALQHVKDKTDLARSILVEEMDERPVYIDRAPVLHKFGIMAFRPQLVKGDAMQISPLIVKGFSADFDGNCCGFQTKIVLTLTPIFVNNNSSDNFRVLLEEIVMRLTGKNLIAWYEKGGREICLPIGKFPTVGKAKRTSKGQEVYAVPDGILLASYVYGKGRVDVPVTSFTVDRNHSCVLVTTRGGRTVEVSDNESLCVFDVESARLKKIKPGDAIGSLSPVIKNDIHIGNCDYGFELGWWYASLAADGWVCGKTVGYSKNDARKRHEFVRIAKNVLGADFRLYEYNEGVRAGKFSSSSKVHLNIWSAPEPLLPVVNDDRSEDVTGARTALFKQLPYELVCNGSRSTLLGLLSGLLDGDATVRWSHSKNKRQFQARLNTSSRYLVESAGLLLRKLGIRYFTTVTPARGRSAESYTVCLSLLDIHKIHAELRLIGKEAATCLQQFGKSKVGRDTGDTLDIIPVSVSLAEVLAKYCRAAGYNALYGIFRKAVSCGFVSRFSANNVIEMIGCDAVKHEHWAAFMATTNDNDVHWDKIVEITPIAAQDVFDFEVPGSKVYGLANGLVIWDTMNFHTPTTDEAAKEAYEKMLPSRSLLSPADFKTPVHSLGQEYQGGVYYSTDPKQVSKRRPRVFSNKQDAIASYRRGDISANDRVEIME